MFRAWPLLIVVLLLAACSSAPTRHDSAPAISTPRAWKPPADLPAFIDHSVGEEEVSIQAMSLVGVPYRWGGNTPDAGFDCSGLVRYVVARAARVDLPRTTAEMSLVGSAIQPDEVAPGDLIYFNTTGRPHSHVGIYVGGYRFVNAPSTGGTVRIDYVSNPYWAKRFDGIRRVASNKGRGAPFDAPQLITSVNPDVTVRGVQASPASRPPEDAAPRREAGASQTAIAGAGAAEGTGVGTARPLPPTTNDQNDQNNQYTSRAVAAEPGAVDRSDASAIAGRSAGRSEPAPAAAPGADAFEPPPPSRAAAQTQAAAEHASEVDPIASFAGTATVPASNVTTNTRRIDTQVPTAVAPASALPVSPAFEPPSRATASQHNDDPIAQFAN